MKTFNVTYIGQNTRFANFSEEVKAENPKQALLKVLNGRIDLFEQEDGWIKDSDNDIVFNPDFPYLFHFDFGYFYSEELN